MNPALQTRLGEEFSCTSLSCAGKSEEGENDLLPRAWTDYSSPVKNAAGKVPAHTCNPSTQRGKQEDCELEASVGYTTNWPYLNKPKQQHSCHSLAIQ